MEKRLEVFVQPADSRERFGGVWIFAKRITMDGARLSVTEDQLETLRGHYGLKRVELIEQEQPEEDTSDTHTGNDGTQQLSESDHGDNGEER